MLTPTQRKSKRDRTQAAIDVIVDYACFEELTDEQLETLERFAESLEVAA